jgi:hypothetical protein
MCQLVPLYGTDASNVFALRAATVGLYELRIQLTHSLKAPGFNPCDYEVKTWFQAFALSNCTFAATPRSKRAAARRR